MCSIFDRAAHGAILDHISAHGGGVRSTHGSARDADGRAGAHTQHTSAPSPVHTTLHLRF